MMNDTLLMRMLECFGYLGRVCQSIRQRDCSTAETVREQFPRQVFEDQIVSSSLLTGIMQNTNVRMIQGRNCSGFLFESFRSVEVINEIRWQDFYSHEPIEFRIDCAVDIAHSAASDYR